MQPVWLLELGLQAAHRTGFSAVPIHVGPTPVLCKKEVLEPGDPWLLGAAGWGALCPRAVQSPVSAALSEMQRSLILLATLTEITYDGNVP